MRLAIAFIITFCFLITSGYRIAAQDIHFKVIEQPKDQKWDLITGMTQDSTGFMWLATWSGLYRYDGSQCVAYTNDILNPNSLAYNRTECVFADKDRFIYVGTYGSGLEQLNPLTGVFRHFRNNKNDPNSLSNDTITAIIKDRNGLLWVGTSDGLNEFDPQTGRCKRFLHNDKDSTSISENDIRVIYEDRDGILWIGTKDPFFIVSKTQTGGLNRYDPKTGKFNRYLHDPNNPLSLVSNTVSAIFEDSHGNLMIGTAGDGLHIMNRQAGTFQRLPYDAKHPENLSRPPVLNSHPESFDDHISFINEDKLGNIWIGSVENGINIYNPVKKMTTHYGSGENNVNKLLNNEFWRAFKSREGIMMVSSWSASGEPLNLYQVNPFEYKFPRTDIGFNPMSFLENEDGSLWIGTDSCLIKKDVHGAVELFPVKIDGKLTKGKNYISAIERDDKGYLWMSPDNGLVSFDPATKSFNGYYHHDNDPASLGCDTVYTLKLAGNNKLWVGTFNGLDLLDIASGKFTHYKHNPNDSNTIGDNIIYSILVKKNSNLLVALATGIDELDTRTGKFIHYKTRGVTTDIVEDKEGRIWAGSDQGLSKYDERSNVFLGYTDYPRILNAGVYIFRIIAGAGNNLFMATPEGLIKLNTKTNEISTYNASFGIIDDRSNQRLVYEKRNGDVLITNASGYFNFNPDNTFKNLPKARVLVTAFSLSDKVVTPGPGSVLDKAVSESNEIQLRYNQNVFSFTYAIIDYTLRDENNPVLYMLENYDLKWRKANSENSAGYFNVPPGNYVFKVKTTNSSGIWVEKDIAVIVNPPWWKTIWAYIFYAIVFIALGFIANRVIRRRIIEKEQIKNREKEMAHAKEIEKAYHELKLTQAQLVQSEKMASLGELTAGIAHEIQNPLNFVNNFSEVSRELIDELKKLKSTPDSNRETSEQQDEILNDIDANLEKINHHGKRADAIVKGMLQHSQRSTGEKAATDINALADEYLRLSYHGLRAKDKSFNATIKTDYDESIGKINIIPQDIGRVLLNLYNNAFYAVNEKKKKQTGNYEPVISVTTKAVKPPSGGLGVVIVTVRDNGSGISQNIVDKIFQPFFTTKPTGQGTGLGLSLSYDIIKAHGGEITVESTENEFSSFILKLPL